MKYQKNALIDLDSWAGDDIYLVEKTQYLSNMSIHRQPQIADETDAFGSTISFPKVSPMPLRLVLHLPQTKFNHLHHSLLQKPVPNAKGQNNEKLRKNICEYYRVFFSGFLCALACPQLTVFSINLSRPPFSFPKWKKHLNWPLC